MNNRNNREGGFYSAKVRQFLNEYGGEILSEKVLHGSRFIRPISSVGLGTPHRMIWWSCWLISGSLCLNSLAFNSEFLNKI